MTVIVYNLFAKIDESGKVEKLIMPDRLGVMDKPTPTGKDWYAVKWPVNPHFTGEFLIGMMLRDGFPNRTPVDRTPVES